MRSETEGVLLTVTEFVYRHRRTTGPQWSRIRHCDMKDRGSQSAVIHGLKHLRFLGVDLDVDEICTWARHHGWKDQDLTALAEYIEGIRRGQRYHTAPNPLVW